MGERLTAAADGVIPRDPIHSRRSALTLAGVSLIAGVATACGPGEGAQARAGGEEPGDFAIGDPNAPVTIIEYASVTCSHCATFHRTAFQDLKTRYIETGKVRFVFRELPTAPANLAVAGFVLARCAGADRYFDVIEVLFERQEAIFRAVQSGTQREMYMRIARNAGLSEDEFNACLADEAMINAIYESSERASEEFNVTGTPAFLINGELTPGLRTIEQFEAALAPYLGEPAAEEPAPAESADDVATDAAEPAADALSTEPPAAAAPPNDDPATPETNPED